MNKKLKGIIKKILNPVRVAIYIIFSIVGKMILELFLEDAYFSLADDILRHFRSVRDFIFHLPPLTLWVLCIITGIIVWFIARVVTRNNSRYFNKVDFCEADKETVRETVRGLLRGKKVEPFYVHAAPRYAEVEQVKSLLEEKSCAHIYDRPGTGKSMLAYHAAYDLFREQKYRIYETSTELDKIENKEVKEVLSDLESLGGFFRPRLVIIDVNLASVLRQKLWKRLKRDIEETNLNCIWIDTDYVTGRDENKAGEDYINLDFARFFHERLYDFCRRGGNTAVDVEILREKINANLPDLRDRVEAGKITSVWQFMFCAGEGEAWLRQKIGDMGRYKLLVLFLISAYTVISSEGELYLSRVQDWIRGKLADKLAWLQEEIEEKGNVRKLVNKLEREQLIIVREDARILSLHYNYAQKIIELSVSASAEKINKKIIGDMVGTLGVLLGEDYGQGRYVGVLYRNLGNWGRKFGRENREWIIDFINNLQVEYLNCYSMILNFLRDQDPEVHEQVVGALDITGMADEISNASRQFPALAGILQGLGDYSHRLLERLDSIRLAELVSKVEGRDLHRAGEFLRKLKTEDKQKYKYLLRNLDFNRLVSAVIEISSGELGQLAKFLQILGKKRYRLLNGIKEQGIEKIAGEIANISPGQLQQAADLIQSLGEYRDDFIQELEAGDWEKLANTLSAIVPDQFDQAAIFLNSLGDYRLKLFERLTEKDFRLLARTIEVSPCPQLDQAGKLLRRLAPVKDKVVKEMDIEKIAIRVYEFGLDSKFRWLYGLFTELGKRKGEFARAVRPAVVKRTNNFAGEENPDELRYLTMFIATMPAVEREKYIKEIKWFSLYPYLSFERHYFKALGAVLENTWRRDKLLVWEEKSGMEEARAYLQRKGTKMELIDEIKHVHHSRWYSGLAKVLWNYNQIAPEAAREITGIIEEKFSSGFRLDPENFRGTGELLNAFYDCDRELAKNFASREIVKDSIVRAIKERVQDRQDEAGGLRHLIKAYYRSAPDLWINEVSRRSCASRLNKINLERIYEEVKGR